MELTTALIAIGNELLKGLVKDLNGPWLGEFLRQNHEQLNQVFICADEESQLSETLDYCLSRFNRVIICGGLGPTQDDVTKHVLAKHFDVPIKKSKLAKELAKSHYERINKEFNPEINQYDCAPMGFTPLANPCGLAPGMFFEDKQTQTKIACLPGVPREFQRMYTEIVHPLFRHDSEHEKMQMTIRTFGIPEEKIFSTTDLWDQLSKYGEVSSLPKLMGVDIGIDLTGDKSFIVNAVSEITKLATESEIKKHIWQIGNLPLAEYIVLKAKEKSLTFGFCESCTGGLVSSQITDVSGSSSVFLGSIISYANEVKEDIVGVKNDSLVSHGAVSVEVAFEMAKNARDKLKTDITIALTGIAGPTGGSEEKPIGTVCIGISNKEKTRSKHYQLHGDRLQLKNRFMRLGLFKLLQEIEKH